MTSDSFIYGEGGTFISPLSKCYAFEFIALNNPFQRVFTINISMPV
jgi:hypothetical protein